LRDRGDEKVSLLLCLLLPVATVAQTDSVAPAACAKCHVEALTQPTTYMAHALETVDKCKILIDHPVLTTTVGKYSYRIERKGNESEYSVTDGTNTVTMPIAGQWEPVRRWARLTFWRKTASLYESRVSWFRELNGLGTTMGYEGLDTGRPHEAAGRLIHHG
jgi:hypothetical protein